MTIEDCLIQDEGMRLRPYLDTAGKLTIAVGRNLEDVGLSEDEAMTLLRNDIAKARVSASKLQFFSRLDPVRQDVVIMMIFNMGAAKFAGFSRMIAALERLDFEAAANEMLASHWASQIGKRAVRLAQMMRSGEYATSPIGGAPG